MEVITFIIGLSLGVLFSFLIGATFKTETKNKESNAIIKEPKKMCYKCGNRPVRFDNLCMSCDDARWGF